MTPVASGVSLMIPVASVATPMTETVCQSRKGSPPKESEIGMTAVANFIFSCKFHACLLKRYLLRSMPTSGFEVGNVTANPSRRWSAGPSSQIPPAPEAAFVRHCEPGAERCRKPICERLKRLIEAIRLRPTPGNDSRYFIRHRRRTGNSAEKAGARRCVLGKTRR